MGKFDRFLCNPSAKTKGFRAQDQTKVPLFAFLLETTPSNIFTVYEERPMPESISDPGTFFPRNKTLDNVSVPLSCEQGHVLGQPRVGHMTGNLCRLNFR